MSTNDPNLIQISIAALAKMVKFDLSIKGKETVGLLIGHEKDGIVYVDDVRLGEQTGNAVHVEVNEQELAMAAAEIDERKDGKYIVGWIHTHPGLSAFLSGTDIKTQKLYQALMPNSIAIVIDPTKYGKTMDINDLDIKVFRVANENPVTCDYIITNTVEFGMNTFVSGDNKVEVHTGSPTPRVYQIPVPRAEKIQQIKAKIDQNKAQLAEEDISALYAWIDLVEAMGSGDVMEVPIEIDALFRQLDNSLGMIDNDISLLRQELEYRKAERTLFAIFLGLILEFSIFYALFAGIL